MSLMSDDDEKEASDKKLSDSDVEFVNYKATIPAVRSNKLDDDDEEVEFVGCSQQEGRYYSDTDDNHVNDEDENGKLRGYNEEDEDILSAMTRKLPTRSPTSMHAKRKTMYSISDGDEGAEDEGNDDGDYNDDDGDDDYDGVAAYRDSKRSKADIARDREKAKVAAAEERENKRQMKLLEKEQVKQMKQQAKLAKQQEEEEKRQKSGIYAAKEVAVIIDRTKPPSSRGESIMESLEKEAISPSRRSLPTPSARPPC